MPRLDYRHELRAAAVDLADADAVAAVLGADVLPRRVARKTRARRASRPAARAGGAAAAPPRRAASLPVDAPPSVASVAASLPALRAEADRDAGGDRRDPGVDDATARRRANRAHREGAGWSRGRVDDVAREMAWAPPRAVKLPLAVLGLFLAMHTELQVVVFEEVVNILWLCVGLAFAGLVRRARASPAAVGAVAAGAAALVAAAAYALCCRARRRRSLPAAVALSSSDTRHGSFRGLEAGGAEAGEAEAGDGGPDRDRGEDDDERAPPPFLASLPERLTGSVRKLLDRQRTGTRRGGVRDLVSRYSSD